MAGSNQPLGDLPHRRFVEIDERHGGARLGKRLRAREAHARSSASDKRDFVFKRQVHNIILSEAVRLTERAMWFFPALRIRCLRFRPLPTPFPSLNSKVSPE